MRTTGKGSALRSLRALSAEVVSNDLYCTVCRFPEVRALETGLRDRGLIRSTDYVAGVVLAALGVVALAGATS